MNKYWRAFLKVSISSVILIVGFIIFYSAITKDDPEAQYDIESMIDKTVAWFDYNKYKKDLENVAFYDLLDVEFIGDTTRLNFTMEYLEFYLEAKCYDRHFKQFPHVDPDKWNNPENEEYRDKLIRAIGGSPDESLPNEIGKIWLTIKTWRLSRRSVYYNMKLVVGTEEDPYIYDDFRLGNTKKTVLIDVIESNMEMMMRLYAKKFFYLRGEPHRAPRVKKI